MSRHAEVIREFHDRLMASFGPQHWWPADTQAEVIVGAILTQNTNWTNVSIAISNLKRAGILDWSALRDVEDSVLAHQIRPAGYYNLKTRRLKNFVRWLWDTHHGDPASLNRLPLDAARRDLLSVNGIGPETADSILLYALNRPIFVIDAYTGRILRRHKIIDESCTYDEMQTIMAGALPTDAKVYNEYHALIVRVAKEHCRARANCAECPLAFHAHDELLR